MLTDATGFELYEFSRLLAQWRVSLRHVARSATIVGLEVELVVRFLGIVANGLGWKRPEESRPGLLRCDTSIIYI